MNTKEPEMDDIIEEWDDLAGFKEYQQLGLWYFLNVTKIT